ncbi:MAG: hypothetical protein COZ80_11120 [Ignavibacteria bacterium CG_4_8_14_3_um_filter_37_9]|nr:hypothetical protein [Ignavibacteria bacterium]PIW98336.1 MAG: hypothetical protein COZ80_11120 [Ignavibacteria bacterium CG_4_8_14_3_um_filter_37_9]PJC57539.1 MAG: hypothetical protein CO025_12855 [Ignavibacteria bacterium CG_4_9_14_0_2_um_filter_37_13]
MNTQFVVCVKNSEMEASLELKKIYEVIEDASAKEKNLIRIIDESGEDYLFPADYFVPITIPQAAHFVFNSM